MTLAEKILARHAGKTAVKAGEFVNCFYDVLLFHDVMVPIIVSEYNKIGKETVFDPDKVVMVNDHYTPNANIKAAQHCKIMREFAGRIGAKNFFDVGTMGIEHALLPEQGLVVPGDLVFGSDSHTCTYGALGAFATGVGSTDVAVALIKGELWLKVPESLKFIYRGKLPPHVTGKDLILYTIGQIGVDGALYKAMEFTGEAVTELSMDSRFTMCNMAIEAGAKTGLVAVDSKTEEYVENRAKRPWQAYQSDEGADYEKVYEFDVAGLEPQVAIPHLPSNSHPVSALPPTTIDQVVIGSCTNGRIEDLRIAAGLLKGRKVAPGVRTLVIPATQDIYRTALKEGLLEIFVDANAAVSTPTCGPCFGGHMGVLAEGERCVSTTNRNFKGRMGHPSSEVYLAGAPVAAASAIMGRIAAPWEVI